MVAFIRLSPAEKPWMMFVIVTALLLAVGSSLVAGFLPSSPDARIHPRRSTAASSTALAARQSKSSSSGGNANSPWKQKPGESEFAYMKRLSEMASRAQDFVIQNTTAAAAAATTSTSTDDTPKKSGYVRVEEWNERAKRANLTWEERVQFEGQKHGDRFMQNEILRKNLNWFG